MASQHPRAASTEAHETLLQIQLSVPAGLAQLLAAAALGPAPALMYEVVCSAQHKSTGSFVHMSTLCIIFRETASMVHK